MTWIIGILTFILVLICLIMILLILVQLPKKEAGMGTAFGGGATDALFGAGTGNALTKLTKYAAVSFFVLTLTLSILNARQQATKGSQLGENLQNLPSEQPIAVPTVDTNLSTNSLQITNVVTTNTPPAGTNTTLTIPNPQVPEPPKND